MILPSKLETFKISTPSFLLLQVFQKAHIDLELELLISFDLLETSPFQVFPLHPSLVRQMLLDITEKVTWREHAQVDPLMKHESHKENHSKQVHVQSDNPS